MGICMNLNSRDFTGTNIKSPAEKMRAMTIITATNDTDGLNKINFSLTFFLQKGSFIDLCYVMGQWATEPVRRSPGKFIRFPVAGKEALKTRSDALLDHLAQRPDLSGANIHSLKTYIHNAIDHEIMYLGNHGSMAQSA
jgi:hypothetical protein